MNSLFLNIIKHKTSNYLIRSLLKPLSTVLPQRFKFPVNGTIKINIAKDKTILLNCNETSHLSRLLYWDGVEGFEHHIFQLFSTLVKNSETFLDIGANVGYYSLVAARLSPQTKVYAFEPVEVINKFLNENIQINNLENISSHKIALSNYSGETDFYTIVNSDFSSSEQLTGDGSMKNDYVKNLNHKTVKVKTETLDNFAKNNNLAKIDLIKMDTEATENLVIEGGFETIQKHRPIIFCEVLKNQIEEKVEDLMLKLNYSFYLLNDKKITKVKSLINSEIGNDYLFLPTEQEQKIIASLN